MASRYGVRMQGATNIALTKLDVLSYMERIPVCAAYEVNGQITHEFPFPVLLDENGCPKEPQEEPDMPDPNEF